MAKGYIVVKRSNKIILIDSVITALTATFILWRKLEFSWALMLVVFPVLTALVLYAFFKWAVVRYIMTILFSMLYGLIAYYIGSSLQRNGVSVSVVFAFAAYFLSLGMHKDHFDFFKSAELIEYE